MPKVAVINAPLGRAGFSYDSTPDAETVQAELEAWLVENPGVEIVAISQSEDSHRVLYTIVYSEG